MRHSSFLGIACCAVVLGGCPRADRKGADTTMSDTTAAGGAMGAPAGTTLSLADVAGRWNMRAVPESGDTTPTTFVLTATADSTGWTVTFPNRKPVPARIVVVAGDSLVSEMGPYESARRKGVQTTTRSVYRMMGDHLTGTTVAHYRTTRPDSVLRLRVDGTRAP